MISAIVIAVIAIFYIAYRFYGRFLSSRVNLDDSRPTPACRINDGIDYVPAKPSLLLGQHFSAIAAAGPIVGPILACLWFGWLPALLWIVFGAIFIGGAHDFLCLFTSVRHDGASVGQIVKEYMPGRTYKFFLAFVWLALVYVIIAFTDITAQTFKTTLEGRMFGPGVAASSVLYLFLAMAMGVALYKFNVKLSIATAICLPLLFAIIWIGPRLPNTMLTPLASLSVKQWDGIILVYCLVASFIPVWLLLQPRGYLGGWFLYMIIIIGFAGALFGGLKVQYPAVNLTGLKSLANGKNVFPILFITVACGACSGFHGIVSAGTTSKQLRKETDSCPVAYGAMLLEGVVAVLAIATVMALPKTSAILKADPNIIYAHGIAGYLGLLRVSYDVALAFALLAFSTFVYDTLDVTTRLARYIFQEFTGWHSAPGKFFAGLLSVIVPFGFLMLAKEKGYLVAWPIFGTSNQLLAAFTLLALSSWLLHIGKKPIYTILPMLFMFVMTAWSLVELVVPFIKSVLAMPGSIRLTTDGLLSGIFGIVLLGLSVFFVIEAARGFSSKSTAKSR